MPRWDPRAPTRQLQVRHHAAWVLTCFRNAAVWSYAAVSPSCTLWFASRCRAMPAHGWDAALRRLAVLHSWARLPGLTSSSHLGSGITASQPAIMTVRQFVSNNVGVHRLL